MRRVWPRWSPLCAAAASPRCAAFHRWSRWPSRPTRIAAAESFCLNKRRNTKFERMPNKMICFSCMQKKQRKKERKQINKQGVSLVWTLIWLWPKKKTEKEVYKYIYIYVVYEYDYMTISTEQGLLISAFAHRSKSWRLKVWTSKKGEISLKKD